MTSPDGGGAVSLRPRARLVRALGDELISSESVAVTELIKNAYDADATDVLLRFLVPLDRGKGSIELLDNGHGMSPETLSTVFMEPATPFRRTASRTRKHGRRVLGKRALDASRWRAWRTVCGGSVRFQGSIRPNRAIPPRLSVTTRPTSPRSASASARRTADAAPRARRAGHAGSVSGSTREAHRTPYRTGRPRRSCRSPASGNSAASRLGGLAP